jgi:hypothetical protein
MTRHEARTLCTGSRDTPEDLKHFVQQVVRLLVARARQALAQLAIDVQAHVLCAARERVQERLHTVLPASASRSSPLKDGRHHSCSHTASNVVA